MLRIEKKQGQATAGRAAGQAAIELAIFGAILIFIFGTIVRSAVSNGYAQNQNFKAMRLAMLDSWQASESAQGKGAGNTSHNNASVLLVEDRLSPDFLKYGDLDRNPYIAQGSGTFSYELFYPWNPTAGDSITNFMPIMDYYINGQHFPFTTASYTTTTLTRPVLCPYATNSCQQNQCLRNQREWVGGIVHVTDFDPVMSAAYSSAIFQALYYNGIVGTNTGNSTASTGFVNQGFTQMPSSFSIEDPNNPGQLLAVSSSAITAIQNILLADQTQYKLFYTPEVNGTPQFSAYGTADPPPACSSPVVKDQALCSGLSVVDAFGNQYTNTNGDMQYDLLRNGDYNSGDAMAVETRFPDEGPMRGNIAWQWAATSGTTAALIGLDANSNEFPQYDIDGRLKEVTIYAISTGPGGSPTVSYEDPDGGDLDLMWDSNSCGPKPGLQNDSQIYTLTQNGTYLQMQEGKLYDPETDQFVRSANKRDTVDLIQRSIQLSNNTGRFCNGTTPLATVGNDGVTPNPVEVCIAGPGANCFSSGYNLAATCYDQNDNMLFVRSRVRDTRGHYWFTDTSGQLSVQ